MSISKLRNRLPKPGETVVLDAEIVGTTIREIFMSQPSLRIKVKRPEDKKPSFIVCEPYDPETKTGHYTVTRVRDGNIVQKGVDTLQLSRTLWRIEAVMKPGIDIVIRAKKENKRSGSVIVKLQAEMLN